jgi:hypothetical protein
METPPRWDTATVPCEEVMEPAATVRRARENVLDALQMVLTSDAGVAGEAPESDREHLRFRSDVKRRDLEQRKYA